MCIYSETMAQVDDNPRARWYRGKRDVWTTESILLPHVGPVRRSVQAQGPVLGIRQVCRIAPPGHVDLLVGYS
jgi:hypothetical protein